MSRRWVSALLCAAVGCGQTGGELTGTAEEASGLGGGPQFEFVPLDYPGARQTIPLVMTEAGLVSGYYVDWQNRNHGFTWQAGVFTPFDLPGATETYLVTAHGGVFQGSYRDAAGHMHGFLYEGGALATLDVPGSAYSPLPLFEGGISGVGTLAFVRNTAGVIAGEYATADHVGHGWIYDGATYTTIDHPDALGIPGSNTLLFGANLDGVVVGRVTKGPIPLYAGFLHDGGAFTPLVHPKQGLVFGTQANGINNLGAVTGVYGGLDGRFHGFLREDGRWYTIDYPGFGAITSEVHGINDDGDLVGGWFDVTGALHGYIAYRIE